MSAAAEVQLIQDIQGAIRGVLGAAQQPTVVELGAFHGEDAAWMSPLAGRYIAIEPDPRNAHAIRNAGLRGITDFLEVAIAAYSGSVTLHLCDNQIGCGTASSSIRKPKEHLRFFPWCTFQSSILVPCLSLNDLYRRYGLTTVELLWVDVQGAERDMIEGGPEALACSHYLFMEADMDEMYEGQASRPELFAMLPAWEIVQQFDYNFLLRNRNWRAS